MSRGFPFARAYKLSRSVMYDSATLWTVARQAPLSMVILQTKCWSVLPCPPSGDPPDPGNKTVSPAIPALKVGPLPRSHWGSFTHGPANPHEHNIPVDSSRFVLHESSRLKANTRKVCYFWLSEGANSSEGHTFGLNQNVLQIQK